MDTNIKDFLHKQYKSFFESPTDAAKHIKHQLNNIFQILDMRNNSEDIFCDSQINNTIDILLDYHAKFNTNRVIRDKNPHEYISEELLSLISAYDYELGKHLKRTKEAPTVYISTQAGTPTYAKKLGFADVGKYHLGRYASALYSLIAYSSMYNMRQESIKRYTSSTHEYDIEPQDSEHYNHDLEAIDKLKTTIQSQISNLDTLFESIRKYKKARNGGRIAGNIHGEQSRRVLTILQQLPINAKRIQDGMSDIISEIREKYKQKYNEDCTLQYGTIESCVHNYDNFVLAKTKRNNI